MAKKIKPTWKERRDGIMSPKYSKEEQEYRHYLIERMTSARNVRDGIADEFDGMSFREYYETNCRAAYSYVRPKKHEEDTRIVTGTTQEKINTLLSNLLNYNLEPSIMAYDEQDLPINSLGQEMEALIKKSREIEDYDDKRKLIYKELLDQGTCFVEEIYLEKLEVKKELFKDLDWSEGVKISKIKWKERLEKVYDGCQANLLCGLDVYLGNIREFDVRQQPFIFTAEKIHYNEAKQIFGKWERWENVPRQMDKIIDTEVDGVMYRDWTLLEMEEDMVEILKFYDKPNNEYQIFLNGVMMLPVSFPLQAISPSGLYPIAKGDKEPISKFFAYSKSEPVKCKVDQAVLDEFLRLMILKNQKSLEPSMANNTNRVLTRKIFLPAVITPDISPDELVPIGNNDGITQTEFAAFELIKKQVDEKTLSSSFEGTPTTKRQTAREVEELNKQSMRKLGQTIWGVVSLERQLSELRLYNIIANWTKPVDSKVDKIKNKLVDIYRTITVETELESGQKGYKRIEMTTDEEKLNRTGEQIMGLEDLYEQETGVPTRISYLNSEMLKTLKYLWKIVITPTEKETSELRRVLFYQELQDDAAIFGLQSLNLEYLKQRSANLKGEDPNKYFLRAQIPPGMGQGVELPGANNQLSKQIAQGVGQTQKPTLNTLAQGLGA